MRGTHAVTFLLFSFFAIFSFWLMFHTFSYDTKAHAMMLSQKVWSDFAQHIPFIRSFSLGENFPPVHPLFPGAPIRYHFLFYALVGTLEKLGIRIDWALNIPSSLGFFLLLSGIYLVAMRLFSSQRVAILSLVFFLFNGSLSFIQFFQKQPLNFKDFPAFAPWGKGDITAFWNLNIYTNQRHLALTFGIALVFLFFLRGRLEDSRRPLVDFAFAVLFGVLFGLFPFFHQPTLLILAVFMATYFLTMPKLRPFLFINGLLTTLLVIPQLQFFQGSTKALQWYPGYLIHDSLSLWHFVSFWWQNLGLHSILVPVGFFLAPKKIRAFFLPVFVLFFLGNMFKFSQEVAANHKFFNFALILGNMLTAYAVTRLWTLIKFIKIIIVIVVVFFLTLSGIIDFFIIAGDAKGALADIPANKTATWIVRNTPKNAIFLNSSFLYHPASLAGRNIFLGWPYFPWSEGYDTRTRLTEMQDMYSANDLAILCSKLKTYHISYITFQSRNAASELVFREEVYQKHFENVFFDAVEGFRIYSTKSGCP